MKPILLIAALLFAACTPSTKSAMPNPEPFEYDLVFDNLATTWDEAMPLGNATLGSLVWQKGNNLRISIDRVDLWDLRPTPELSGPEFTFKWLYRHVMERNYKPVQDRLDRPYDEYPGPSKIPGAALEFPLEQFGEVASVHLYIRPAVCQIRFTSGVRMLCFIHAEQPVGWYVIEGLDTEVEPLLVPPSYAAAENLSQKPDQSRHSLHQLGYRQGTVKQPATGEWIYEQPGWGDFNYAVAVKWKREGKRIVGAWSATSSLVEEEARDLIDQALERGIAADYQTHTAWWKNFWHKSSVTLPDKVIERQYSNEVYKMGSIARRDSYPISLQAVWTADNGNLPPWKGDFHHDLNTQLSYWPFYTGNYLDEGYGYLHTLWNQREKNKAYTRHYFGTEGLNVPGVCTLTGEPMGGWVQYSLGPTVSAWLAQHFYLHWQYSRDREFLRDRAYPYLRDVATYLGQFTVLENGVRKLPLSSSPEYNDNSLQAWFHQMTNFDIALTRFAFGAAAELADELELPEESAHWRELQSQLPEYDLDATGGLTIAPGHPYNKSHRHFSNLLAIHPLGLIDPSHGEQEAGIIRASLANLDQYGSDYWTGYSFSWAGCLKARAFDGEGAAQMLRDFAEAFCLRNGFHANGDQSGTGKSTFTYRPFTLEGNMAFAAGVQEMLLQSHTGVIRVFPAIPTDWKEASFEKLRAVGAFVVSAEHRNGKVTTVEILSEKGGTLRLANPFPAAYQVNNVPARQLHADVLTFDMQPGEHLRLTGGE